MKRGNRLFPPNCTVCDLNPSRFLAFRKKQNEIEAQYGFRLGIPCRTPEQKEGHRRYMRDWHKRYRSTHPATTKDRRAYKNDWCLRKRVEKRLGRKPTADEMAAARAAFEAKKSLHEERKRIAKEEYGFDLGTVPMDMSPEEAEARKRFRKAEKDKWKAEHPDLMREYHRRSNLKERQKKIRRRISIANLAKAREKQMLEAQRRRAEAEEVRRKAILEKYGYDISKEPETA